MHIYFLGQLILIKNVSGLKIHIKYHFLLQHNSSLGRSTLMHIKTAINDLLKTVSRSNMVCTEAEIRRSERSGRQTYPSSFFFSFIAKYKKTGTISG